MKEVEVIKIGDVLRRSKSIVSILTINDGGEILDYYLNIFLENMKDEIKEKEITIQKTAGGVLSVTPRLGDVVRGKVPTGKGRKGIEDGEPEVDQVYQLKDGWHTSRIEKVIDGCVLLTMNSIYAIHNVQNFREKKLKDLGI